MTAFTFNTTRSIINEAGGLKRLAEVCAGLRFSKPLIVTDPGIVNVGLLDKLKEVMDTTGLDYMVYSEVVADPPVETIMECLDAAKAHGADGVIGFGGGSSMDAAKLVALLLKSGEKLEDIYGVGLAKGERLPLILIPTTAGTGSEVTAVAIVTTGPNTKAGVVANQLYPDVALLDAELTTGLPPIVTAATGVDAMVHAIEAYTSLIQKNPYSDMLAMKALELLSKNLKPVIEDGKNLEARQNMLFGACLAGQAFANAPVAAVHALAYPLGARYHIPHGTSNALLLPHVLRFNSSAAAKMYAELAPVCFDNVPSGSNETTAAWFADQLEQLSLDVGLPPRMRDAGVTANDLDLLAEEAMGQTRLLKNNPRPVSQSDARAIYEAAF
ncbi:MAG: alcohol dehydrogenase [Ponticaulis sp.]|nr:alcohol dehydrogenase [Ponticaulis sp.]|tara:strand:- start:19173 stop:20327 length:1155 start_codon:yes stop_codon:yes gene_type:complete